MNVRTAEDFKRVVQEMEGAPGYVRPRAFAVGLGTVDGQGKLLEVFYPTPNHEANFGTAAVLAKLVKHPGGTASYRLTAEQLTDALAYFAFIADDREHPNVRTLKFLAATLQSPHKPASKVVVLSFIAPAASDPGPQDTADTYLRLHLLSHRLVRPHGISLEGMFALLPNVAWTSEGAIALSELSERKAAAFLAGRDLQVHSVDKFPRMTDYVVPSGVRIADAARVRLGAYLGEGTTVMHEGFINFNSGCEGPNMIEGRISAGVFVEKGSDLGGGCSTMGTLSGGGKVVIGVGADCLLGANSGLGIPLGQRCTVEAGLYITAGTKLRFQGQVVKARDLAGRDDLLFRRNSETGAVEALLKPNALTLNDSLHSHN